MSRNQGSGPARQVANAWRPLKNNRGAANNVLAHQRRRAASDVLGQAEQRLTEYHGDQNDRESVDFLSVSRESQLFMLSSRLLKNSIQETSGEHFGVRWLDTALVACVILHDFADVVRCPIESGVKLPHSKLVERCGSMLLRRPSLVQVVESQDRQQYNESERVRGDVESKFNQAV